MMKRWRITVVLALIMIMVALCSKENDSKEEKIIIGEHNVSIKNGIPQMNPDNFFDIVNQYNVSFIKFYAPGCGHCVKIAPAFAQLSRDFAKDPKVFIGEINTSTYSSFTDIFHIFHIPTLYVFQNGIKIGEYDQGKSVKEMTSFLMRMKHLLIEEITSVAEIDEIQSYFTKAVIYFGDNNDDIKEFKELFGPIIKNVCKSEEIMKHYNVKPRTIVLFKNFDEKRNDYVIEDKLDFIEGSQFLMEKGKPYVEVLTYEVYIEMYTSDKGGVILFVNGNEKKELVESYTKTFLEIARKAKKEVFDEDNETIFTVVDITKEGIAKTISQSSHVTLKSSFPIIQIIDYKKDKKNYTYKGDFTIDAIVGFINQWKNDQLVPIQLEDL